MTTDAPKARVLVADDHPLYREALEHLVARADELELAGAVTNLPEALMVLQQTRCDLVLLDLMMPGMAGVESVRKVREIQADAKVVLISGHMTADIVTTGLAVGATGFLSKTFSPQTLLAALRLVLTGAAYVPTELLLSRAPVPAARQPQKIIDVDANYGLLNSREIDVLHRMAEGASNKEIGRELGLAEVTIKLHTQRIVRKLGVKNRTAAIATAVRDGLIQLPH